MQHALGLTQGELTIVVFVVFTVLSARYWPRLGERLAERLGGRNGQRSGRAP